jgi:hypothetical protein
MLEFGDEEACTEGRECQQQQFHPQDREEMGQEID